MKSSCDAHWIYSIEFTHIHYDDVMMGTIASQITSLTIVYSTVWSAADQNKHQSSASLAFVWGIHQGPVNSPHKWPVTRKMFPFHAIIMKLLAKYILSFASHTPIKRAHVCPDQKHHSRKWLERAVRRSRLASHELNTPQGQHKSWAAMDAPDSTVYLEVILGPFN